MITEAQLNLFEDLRTQTLEVVRNVGFKGNVLVEVEIEYMQLASKLIDRANKPVTVPAQVLPDLAPSAPPVQAPPAIAPNLAPQSQIF